MVGDPKLYAGGISAMSRGNFLDPHIDNSHDSERVNYRVLNLLYYCTPDWPENQGGNFELWDRQDKRPLEIHSRFNRLLIMETTRCSWHSVNKVKGVGVRHCVSNYYFSPQSLDGGEYFHVTRFRGRPEQPIKQMIYSADALFRTLVRKVVKGGIGRNDIHRGPDAV